jgi:hypothetical protein
VAAAAALAIAAAVPAMAVVAAFVAAREVVAAAWAATREVFAIPKTVARETPVTEIARVCRPLSTCGLALRDPTRATFVVVTVALAIAPAVPAMAAVVAFVAAREMAAAPWATVRDVFASRETVTRETADTIRVPAATAPVIVPAPRPTERCTRLVAPTSPCERATALRVAMVETTKATRAETVTAWVAVALAKPADP